MAKEKANNVKPDDAVVNQMEKFNSNPAMRVVETINEKGDLLQKEVEIFPRASSNVEYAVDSKGNVKPKVKVYHENPNEAFLVATELMEKAMDAAKKLSKTEG
jgi:PBP1b-binding outer membrane lipoprotein LpoB|tara:strand:- start:487 stop:795 length:309 start_codon:yes stop_codon:yes gene_type:complete